MNYFSKDKLTSAIEKETSLVELHSDESSIIISEYGGRLLGIFPRKHSYNLLWVNPNIKELIKTRSWEIGGDRYWISPERDFFYKNPEKWQDWECPPSLDPANYEILASSKNSCTLSTNVLLMNQRTKLGSQGEITRQFKLVKDPYHTGLKYCGIDILDDCVLYRPNLKVNGWSLAQVISGGVKEPGTVLIPTKNNPKPLSYFDKIPEDYLKIEQNYVTFKIDVENIYKLAIRPEDIDYERPAKIGYMLKLPDSEEFGFIIKISNDIPKNQTECFDISRDHPDLEIGVIQSYNSDSPNKPSLNFGELELQLNPFKTIDNASHGKSLHQIFGYNGSKEEILTIVEKSLGIIDPKLF
ncbi:MAG: DUF6786 family protein [Candidatus Thorarchaeota archaeon]